MPLIAHIEVQEDTAIALWKVKADERPPATSQRENPTSGNTAKKAVEKRERERLGVHHCLEQLGLYKRIRYTPKGKPYLNRGPHISISHGADKAAVISSRKRRVGIDIDRRRAKILKIEPKFIGESERAFIPIQDRMDYLHVIWGAKESLYKLCGGERPLSFQENMRVAPFALAEKGRFACAVQKEDFYESFEGFYQSIEDSYLVYCLAL